MPRFVTRHFPLEGYPQTLFGLDEYKGQTISRDFFPNLTCINIGGELTDIIKVLDQRFNLHFRARCEKLIATKKREANKSLGDRGLQLEIIKKRGLLRHFEAVKGLHQSGHRTPPPWSLQDFPLRAT